jgi:hypothetical protein
MSGRRVLARQANSNPAGPAPAIPIFMEQRERRIGVSRELDERCESR